MASNLEPTYLRFVYDGLISGSVHPENASELPDGLVGVYEEAFDSQTSVVIRQELLERFAIWALVKKEVSASFIAEVLGETEDNILEFVSTCSSWFNSPESGKYQLYHERLKVQNKYPKLDKAEKVVLEIMQSSKRNNTWKQFVGDVSNTDLAQMEFDRSFLLKSEEAQKHYRKGWCENVSLVATDTFLISKVLPVLVEDVESIETILQKYALHMLTLQKSSKENINRLNRTLNIQWAIDIINPIN